MHTAIFVYLFYVVWAAPGLRCCTRAPSSTAWGLLSSCGARAAHCGSPSCRRAQALGAQLTGCGLQALGLRGCGARAQLLRGMWNRPPPGAEPVPRALAGGLSTRASLVAQLEKNPLAMWETWVRSLDWEDPLETGKATHSSILAWRIPWTA